MSWTLRWVRKPEEVAVDVATELLRNLSAFARQAEDEAKPLLQADVL